MSIWTLSQRQNYEDAICLGMVGINLRSDWILSANQNSASSAMTFSIGWIADPIFGNGDYPAEMKAFIGSDKPPVFTQEEIALNKGSRKYCS